MATTNTAQKNKNPNARQRTKLTDVSADSSDVKVEHVPNDRGPNGRKLKKDGTERAPRSQGPSYNAEFLVRDWVKAVERMNKSKNPQETGVKELAKLSDKYGRSGTNLQSIIGSIEKKLNKRLKKDGKEPRSLGKLGGTRATHDVDALLNIAGW